MALALHSTYLTDRELEARTSVRVIDLTLLSAGSVWKLRPAPAVIPCCVSALVTIDSQNLGPGDQVPAWSVKSPLCDSLTSVVDGAELGAWALMRLMGS